MKKILALILLLIASLASAEPRKTVLIQTGFLTGNTFKELSSHGKSGYAMGVIGGIFLAPFFDSPPDETIRLKSCIVEMSDDQIVAIFEKFLADHPERWHDHMNVLAFSSLKEICD